ncbi:MAG: hypothetical protein ACQCN6_13635 [Candidatus Bathyarchaeia archaeon]|jgi:hypothetical protein
MANRRGFTYYLNHLKASTISLAVEIISICVFYYLVINNLISPSTFSSGIILVFATVFLVQVNFEVAKWLKKKRFAHREIATL